MNVEMYNHPSIIAIPNKCKDKESLNFIEAGQEQSEISKLDINKASQSSDFPVKVLKENTYIFNNFLCNSFNNSIKLSTFPEILKHADIIPLYKRGKKISKETTDQLAYFQIYKKYLKLSLFL